MARCLVTGAAGMIGSHVCDSLLEQGHTVHGIDDLSGGFRENVPAGVVLHRGSFVSEILVELAMEFAKPDYIFHCGAYAAEGLSPFIRRFNYMNNLVGSVNLINAAVKHNVKCFVFTSSIAVYGDQVPPFYEEVTTPRPIDPYGIAKYAVELDLAAAQRLWGMPYIIFRPHNVYGERQNCADPYRNVIGIFMRQCLAGEPLTIFGDGTQQRAFTHVSDVANVIANSVDIPEAMNQTFNLGSSFPVTVELVAELVQQAMGSHVGVIHLPERHEAKAAWCDHYKAQSILGAVNQVALVEGIRRMAKWVKENPPQKPTPFSAIEVDKGLPASWASMAKVGV
jgi:UDP-glucose 4-epimerase